MEINSIDRFLSCTSTLSKVLLHYIGVVTIFFVDIHNLTILVGHFDSLIEKNVTNRWQYLPESMVKRPQVVYAKS